MKIYMLLVVTAFGMLIPLIMGQDRSCSRKTCHPPNCTCPYLEYPMDKNSIPQMVYFGFDDAVNTVMSGFYDKLFTKRRTNPNGCPIKMSLYISHQYTDYNLVKKWYRRGMEIGVHSVSHSAIRTENKLKQEARGQKDNLARLAGVPKSEIVGWRSPFLMTAGDVQPKVLKELGFEYDVSLTYQRRKQSDQKPWPFTMQDGWPYTCGVMPCPFGANDTDFWAIPVISLIDHAGKYPCVFVDGCMKQASDADTAFKYLWDNFMSFYSGTRTPFGLHMHAAWFYYDYKLEAMGRFLDELGKLNDVYVITAKQVIDWMKNPKTLSEIDQMTSWGCPGANTRRITPPRPTARVPQNLPNVRQNVRVRTQTPKRFPAPNARPPQHMQRPSPPRNLHVPVANQRRQQQTRRPLPWHLPRQRPTVRHPVTRPRPTTTTTTTTKPTTTTTTTTMKTTTTTTTTTPRPTTTTTTPRPTTTTRPTTTRRQPKPTTSNLKIPDSWALLDKILDMWGRSDTSLSAPDIISEATTVTTGVKQNAADKTMNEEPATSGAKNNAEVLPPAPIFPPNKGACQQGGNCRLPDCFCQGSVIPKKLNVKDIPQMVYVTIDGSVNPRIHRRYRELVRGKFNPNGCQIKGTIFVSESGTYPYYLRRVYNSGAEIGLRGVHDYRFHRAENMEREIQTQIRSMLRAGVKNIKGFRTPELVPLGDEQFGLLQKYRFEYDSTISLPRPKDHQHKLWPFTLDYGFTGDCPVPECPKKKYPGLWVVPNNPLMDFRHMFECTYVDGCMFNPPTKNDTVQFLWDNFMDNYKTNRAPFGLHLRQIWFEHPAFAKNLDGLKEFLSKITRLNDVYVTTVSEVLEWMKQPTKLTQIKDFSPWKCS